jgi:glycosyltransferase involved in cell wall biosynthesis
MSSKYSPDQKDGQVTAYIIAFNEIDKISDAVRSVLWADEVIVIDSFSTDGTTEVAESLGARVVHVPFKGYGPLRNSALSECKSEWIFSLDADERCTDAVANEVREIISRRSVRHDIFFVPRRNFFWGKWIRHSGWYPNYRQPQLFRRGALTYDDLPVHEGFVIHSGMRPGFLKNSIWQVPFKDVGEILRKADKYSALGASKLSNKHVTVWSAFGHGLWSFFKHYFLKLGILDGGPGLIIAIGNFEGTFYRYLRAIEQQQKRGTSGE